MTDIFKRHPILKQY